MKIRTVFLASISILIFSGCGSIVKKPDINNVKTIALISVYANDTVPEKNNHGKVNGWNNAIKQDVSSGFYNIYSKSFTNLGWKVIPMKRVASLKSYQAYFKVSAKTNNETMNKIGNFLNKLSQMNEKYTYFTPNGLHVMQVNNQKLSSITYLNGKRVDFTQQLADLAKELHVDAVAVVQIDYCYEGGTFSIMGTGKGYITAASTIHAVDKHGNVVINMGDLGRCVDTSNRAESDTGYAMIGGNLFISFAKDNTVRKMFMEATRKSAHLTVAEIQKAMK